MASERTWPAVSQAFVADGTALGAVKVTSTDGFKVKARVLLLSNSQPFLALEVKSIPDSQTIFVGPCSKDMLERTDVSAYLVSDSATIKQDLQKRPPISPGDSTRAVYEEEPTVALRTIPVSEDGDLVDPAIDGITPSEFDDVKLTRDINTDVQTAAFYKRGKLLWTLNVTRDLNTDVIEVKRINS